MTTNRRSKRMPRLVTSAQLAKRLQVTRRTVKRYKARGLISPRNPNAYAHKWDLEECLERLHEAGLRDRETLTG